MKYGLLYFKETDNLGDDIQAYASKQFLPRVDYIIDRESLNCFVPDEKEYVSVIMNAWYMHNKSAWPPSPYINPLLISMHFSYDDIYDVGDKYLLGESAKYLNEHGPVGARDESTEILLKKNGIDAYFSGCMTLTLKRFEDVQKQDYICVVDGSNEVAEKVKANTNKEVRIITHTRNPEDMKNKSIDERMSDVEKQLREYQAASLIVTDRLHVALPALALGTPVILIRNNNIGQDRIGTFEKFTTHFQKEEFLNNDIKELINNPKENNEDYLEIRNNVIKSCEEFIKKTQIDLNTDKLPDVNDFKRSIDVIKWHNDLFYEFKKKLCKVIDKNYYDVKSLWDSWEDEKRHQREILEQKENEIRKCNEVIEKKNEELTKTQEELFKANEELDRIYNSRTWKLREKIVNFRKK